MSKSSESPACPHNANISCGDCRLSSICLPLSLDSEDISKLDQIVEKGAQLQRGETLYKQDGEFRSVYAVRAGAIKAYHIDSSGHEQVVGFYLPGEILGTDGIGGHRYNNTAVALDTTAVCEIPFAQLEQLSAQLPFLQRHFFRIMSREITDDQKMLTLISKNTADERLASFLISLSTRHAQRQLSGSQFLLPMSRQDIGNFLGLTIETVSRVFTRFRKNLLIEVDGKYVQILNIDALKEVARIAP